MNLPIWQVAVMACLARLAFCGVMKNSSENKDVMQALKGKEPSDLCPATNSRFSIYISDPEDCSQFYICDNKVPYLKKCPNGLHFNVKQKACDYPETAGCDKDAVGKGKGRIAKEKFDTCPEKNSKFPVYLPDPDDCSRFFICDNGIPHSKKCLPGLHFNPSINACDYPKNAKCDTREPKGRENGNYLGMCRDEDSTLPEYHPHPDECNKFYICQNGLPLLQKCPPGLHFNPKFNVCDYPGNSGCNTGFSMMLRGMPLDDAHFISCPDEDSPDSPVLYSHPTDCDKFYECDHGELVLKSCDPGLNFNGVKRACGEAENTVCEKEMTPAFAGVRSPFCPSVDIKIPVFFRHPTNCSIFFMCSNGFAYEFVCPARLHFNIRKRFCDYEENAKCKTN